MKLHLTKSLHAALLACVCAMAEAVAADIPEANTSGDIWLKTDTYTPVDGAEYLFTTKDDYNAGGDPTFDVQSGEVGIKIGEWKDKGGERTYTKIGDGTLTINGLATIKSQSSSAADVKGVNVNDGTLKLNYDANYSSVTVANGAKLEVATGKTLTATNGVVLDGGGDPDSYLSNYTGAVVATNGNYNLNGGAVFSSFTVTSGSRADVQQDYTGALTLSGHGDTGRLSAMCISGGKQVGNVTVTSEGASIAVWEGNSATLSNGLVLNGNLYINGNDQGVKYAVTGAYGGDFSGEVKVSGAVTGSGDIEVVQGSLKLNSGATVDNTVSFTVSNGKLDLSDVKTLSIESLDLAAGTTIVLGKETRITISDALTIGNGVIFDLSSWCTYEGFEPYELFTLGTDATFTPPANTFVTIHTSNGDNTQAFLSYDATTNKVMLVPEPTTATLSLLALAGLAARRRRK